MRIRLKKGKQKNLILLAKKNITWKELAKKINSSEGYLRNELLKEKRTLSEKIYKNLCKISKTNFNKDISKRLDENWGRSKGGVKSSKNLKKIVAPKKSEDLAEIIGIILGDGHVSEFKREKKIRCYFIRIVGNSKTDKEYISLYIPKIFEKVFNEKGSLFFPKTSNVGYFTLYGKAYIDFLNSLGIKSGNKKTNNQGIPKWIKKNAKYMSKCIKGLIDTDGSIHYISKNNLNLRVNYTSYIPQLLKDVREGLIKLGFAPSKMIKEKQIFLSSKRDVQKYVKEIGFGNQKNLNRLKILQEQTPL